MKRHGYYCRSRRATGAVRARSCIACARGKARCDNKRPECSRCKSKGVECHYPTKTSNASKSTTQQHANDAETERLNTIAQSVADIPGLDTFLDATNDGDIPLDRALVIADSEITAVGERYSDDIMPDVDFADLLNVHMDGENILYTPSGSSSSVYQSISSADEVVQVQHPNLRLDSSKIQSFQLFSRSLLCSTNSTFLVISLQLSCLEIAYNTLLDLIVMGYSKIDLL